MLSNAPFIAFLPTTDPTRTKAFYRNTLGLTLIGEDPDGFALTFSVQGAHLRVVTVDKLTPHAFTSAGWKVPDIAATVAGLVARGVVFETFPGMAQDAQGIWTSPGAVSRVAWFKDPDGNLLSVTQLL